MNKVPEAFILWLQEHAPVSIDDVTLWIKFNALDEPEPLALAYRWLLALIKDRTIKILPSDPNHPRWAPRNYVAPRKTPKPTSDQMIIPE